MATKARQTLFLLSPARTDGRRGRALLGAAPGPELAERLRGTGAPIGEVFRHLSGLYFRGKLAYAEAFARPEGATHGAWIIAPGLGLVPPGTPVTLDGVRAIGAIGVAPEDPRFREPLECEAARLASALRPDGRVVLLGSIATGKYVDVLEGRLGRRLHFPVEFVGRGDMSRGGLMLRCVAAGRELEYVPVAGAVRRGPRPPRLEPIR